MAKNKETIIQNAIQDHLNKEHIFNVRMNASATMAGMPDLFCIYRGYAVALEVKTLEGKPTELQKRIVERFRASGGYGCFPTSIWDVDELLEEIDEDIKTFSDLVKLGKPILC
jgi:hypothetical protein